MIPQNIIDRIIKVKALADNGSEGERQAAIKTLKNLMKKYNISEEDLIGEEQQVFFFKVNGTNAWELFKHISIVKYGVKQIMYLGSTADAKKVRTMSRGVIKRGDNACMICTRSQFLEIQATYLILQNSLNKHVESLFYAFLGKNDLLAPSNPDNPTKFSEEELMMYANMFYAVQKTPTTKALPQISLI